MTRVFGCLCLQVYYENNLGLSTWNSPYSNTSEFEAIARQDTFITAGKVSRGLEIRARVGVRVRAGE